VRLLRNIGRLEAAALAAKEERADGARIGVVWTDCEGRISAMGLKPGEMIAADLYFTESYGGSCGAGADPGGIEPEDGSGVLPGGAVEEGGPASLRLDSQCHGAKLIERVTTDRNDLGFVYLGAPGAPGTVRVGRVVEVDGGLLTWREVSASASAGLPD
jgi:hypothetical protein